MIKKENTISFSYKTEKGEKDILMPYWQRWPEIFLRGSMQTTIIQGSEDTENGLCARRLSSFSTFTVALTKKILILPSSLTCPTSLSQYSDTTITVVVVVVSGDFSQKNGLDDLPVPQGA